jgi:hypothetical protein
LAQFLLLLRRGIPYYGGKTLPAGGKPAYSGDIYKMKISYAYFYTPWRMQMLRTVAGILLMMTLTLAASAMPRDYLELGLGGHLMLDQGTFNTPNELNHDRDVFPLNGDFGFGLNGDVLLGHRYQNRDFIIKYHYYQTFTASGTDEYDKLVADYGFTSERSFRSHTVLFGMRQEFQPLERFHSFIDLAAGVVTGVYDINYLDGGEWVTEKKTVQSGFAANFGIGFFYLLNPGLDVFVRGDLFLGKIPDAHDAQNYHTGNGPSMNALSLNFGLRKFFTAPF